MVLARMPGNADSLLLPRARAGDADALAELMREYGGVVRRLVGSFVRDSDDARDVEQDTWIRAAANLHQLRDDGRFAPWLKSIARTTSLNFLAARRRTQQRVSSFEDCGTTDFEDDGPDGSPEASALSHDNQRKVWEVLGSLSERDRTALFLRESRDMPYEEIAERLGISRNAAEVCVFRARERFRKLFVTIENRPQRCGFDPLRLASLIDDEADADSRRTLQEHVDSCEGCAQRLATMQSGRSLYRKMAGLLLPFGGWSPLASLASAWSRTLAVLGLGGSGAAGASGATAASATGLAVVTPVATGVGAAGIGAAAAGVAGTASAPLLAGVTAVVVTIVATAGVVVAEAGPPVTVAVPNVAAAAPTATVPAAITLVSSAAASTLPASSAAPPVAPSVASGAQQHEPTSGESESQPPVRGAIAAVSVALNDVGAPVAMVAAAPVTASSPNAEPATVGGGGRGKDDSGRTSDVRGNGQRTPEYRDVERGGTAERGAAERGAAERGAAERGAAERGAAERGTSSSSRSGAEGASSRASAPERSSAAAAAPAAGERAAPVDTSGGGARGGSSGNGNRGEDGQGAARAQRADDERGPDRSHSSDRASERGNERGRRD